MTTAEKHTSGPWHWRRAENGQGSEETTLVGSPDQWEKCYYSCFGWGDGSEVSRGTPGEPGHEHNKAPTVLCATGWHGSGDILIDINSPDAHLIAAAPTLLEAAKMVYYDLTVKSKWPGSGYNVSMESFRALEVAIAAVEGKV